MAPRFICSVPVVHVWPAGRPLGAALVVAGRDVLLSWDASSIRPQLYRKQDRLEWSLYSWSLVTNDAAGENGRFLVSVAGDEPAEFFTLFSEE